MRLTYGKTRIVFLCGGHAYKFGKIRPLRFACRLILMLFSEHRRMHFYEKYGRKFWAAAWNDVFAGPIANRNEYLYYKDSHDERVMPTTKCLLHGWLVIQERGVPVGEHELASDSRVHQLVGSCETRCARQFARSRTDARIRLIDYGRTETTDFLKSVA